MRSTFAGLALLAVLGSSGPGFPGKKASRDERAVAKSVNRLACDLYASFKERPGNLVFSPGSISMALAMTWAGARTKTAGQMAKALHFGLPARRLHKAYAALLESLDKTGEGVRIQVANRLWGGYGEEFKKNYLDLLRANYGAELVPLDFAGKPEESIRAVNAWVDEKTEGKVKRVLESQSIDKQTTLVLANAVYFKGLWVEAFDPGITRNLPFFITAKQQVDVATMEQQGRFDYYESDDLQILSLPYRGGRFSMVILLPEELEGLKGLEKKLTSSNLDRWLRKLRKRKVNVALPRFRITFGSDLEKILVERGMVDAFSAGKADFSGINGKKNLFLSKVVHRAMIEVDEKGTEAAAVTLVKVKKNGGPPSFRADHPFIFLIRDEYCGQILFIGRLVDPS